MHWDHEPRGRSPKRRRSGALQDLADVRARVTNALASCSAAVLRRFRRAIGLGIRGSWRASSALRLRIGTLNRYEPPSPPLWAGERWEMGSNGQSLLDLATLQRGSEPRICLTL